MSLDLVPRLLEQIDTTAPSSGSQRSGTSHRRAPPPPPTVDTTGEQLREWAAAHRLSALLDLPMSEFLYFGSRWNWQRHLYIDGTLQDFFAEAAFLRKQPSWRNTAADVLPQLVDLHRIAQNTDAERARLMQRVDAWVARNPDAPLRPVVAHLRSLVSDLWSEHTQIYDWKHRLWAQVDAQALVLSNTGCRLSLANGIELTWSVHDPHSQLSVATALMMWLILDDREPDVEASLARLGARFAMPRWRRMLDEVEHALILPPDDNDKPLFAWRVYLDSGVRLQPMRCRLTKRGDRFVTKRMQESEFRPDLQLEPQDLHLMSALHTAKGRPVGQLDRLVGHPRVFFEDEKRPRPVRRGQLHVGIRQTPEGRVLQLELDGQPIQPPLVQRGRSAWSGGWLVDTFGSAFRVTPVDLDTLHVIRASAGVLGMVMPAEASAAIAALLPTLGSRLPLASDPEVRGRSVQGDARPVVRLAWQTDPDALTVALRTQPLPDHAARVPGQGSETLFTTTETPDGPEIVHVQRNLPAERAVFTGLAEALGLIGTEETGPFEWRAADLDQALTIVHALQSHPDPLRVTWAGARLRVAGTAHASDLSIKVSSGIDWLGLEGGLTVNGEPVALQELLRAALDGHAHVQLASGDWVALDAQVREALTAAAAVRPTQGRDEARISPLHAGLLEDLADAGARIEGEDWQDWRNRITRASTFEASIPEGLSATLRPYQQQGFEWLARLSRWAPGGCLADDMGLGKTVQALALLLHLHDRHQGTAQSAPFLVVAPTSVSFNWVREAGRFAPDLNVRVYRGSDRGSILTTLEPGDLVITSYGILVRDAEALAAHRFSAVILDEAQAIKNASTARAKAAFALDAGFRLALSGTPIENRTSELFSLFRFIAPGLLGSAAGFNARFANPIEHGDTERRAVLARIVGPFILRRTKREVARDLPDRIEQVYRVIPSVAERRLYERHRLEAIVRAEKGARFEILAELQRLRQLACHPKMVDPDSPIASSKLKAVVRTLADLASEGHRALVFSSFTKHLALVRTALDDAGLSIRYLDGSTPLEARRREVDAFQDGHGDCFLISLKAGGTGLNLTAATYVLHLDPWWNPAAEDQATDRAHRIGQNQTVTVYRFVTVGTVEEQIVDLHAHKRELAQALLSGSGESRAVSVDELRDLLAAAHEPELASHHPADPSPTEPSPADPTPASPVHERAASEWVAAFGAWLDAQERSGALKRATVRAYRGALQRLVAERGPEAPVDSESFSGFLESNLADMRAGRIGSKSDKVFGSPAIGRMVAWLREPAAQAP